MKLLKIIGFGAFIMLSSSLWVNAQVKPDTSTNRRRVDSMQHKTPRTSPPAYSLPNPHIPNTDTVYRNPPAGHPAPISGPPKSPALMKVDTSGEHPKK